MRGPAEDERAVITAACNPCEYCALRPRHSSQASFKTLSRALSHDYAYCKASMSPEHKPWACSCSELLYSAHEHARDCTDFYVLEKWNLRDDYLL